MKRTTKLLMMLALLSAALVTVTPVLASGGGWNILGQHTVKSGETLYCIGRAYGVDPWAIGTQNAIVNVNSLTPGMVLSIPNAPKTLPAGPVCTPQFVTTPDPAPSPTPVPVTPTPSPRSCGGCTCTSTHTVIPGDTLTQIALLYGTDMWTIAQCNCIYDMNYIRSGDALCIP